MNEEALVMVENSFNIDHNNEDIAEIQFFCLLKMKKYMEQQKLALKLYK